MSYETVEGEETRRTVRLRRLARRDGHLPFIPFGLIPLAGLSLLFLIALWPFAFGVQNATKRAVTEALAANGIDGRGLPSADSPSRFRASRLLVPRPTRRA